MTCCAELHLQCVILNTDQHESFSTVGAESTEVLQDASIHHIAAVHSVNTDLLNNGCYSTQARLFGTDKRRKSIASIY